MFSAICPFIYAIPINCKQSAMNAFSKHSYNRNYDCYILRNPNEFFHVVQVSLMCIQLIDETIFEDFPLKYLNIFSIFYSRKKGQIYTHNTRFAMHKIEIINNYGSGRSEKDGKKHTKMIEHKENYSDKRCCKKHLYPFYTIFCSCWSASVKLWASNISPQIYSLWSGLHKKIESKRSCIEFFVCGFCGMDEFWRETIDMLCGSSWMV